MRCSRPRHRVTEDAAQRGHDYPDAPPATSWEVRDETQSPATARMFAFAAALKNPRSARTTRAGDQGCISGGSNVALDPTNASSPTFRRWPGAQKAMISQCVPTRRWRFAGACGVPGHEGECADASRACLGTQRDNDAAIPINAERAGSTRIRQPVRRSASRHPGWRFRRRHRCGHNWDHCRRADPMG